MPKSIIIRLNEDVEPVRKKDNKVFSVDDIVNNYKIFYSNEQNYSGLCIGVSVALREATIYAGNERIVLSMPGLIAAKIKADKTHDFWQKWYTVQTEENIGVDKKGLFVKSGKPVLLVVHGGGLLTPDRIDKAYFEGLINNSAKYTEKEFEELLEGKLPNGNSIRICTIDEIKKGVSDLPRRYAVALDYKAVQKTKSGYHDKREFVENQLVIARVVDMNNLETYFYKAKNSTNNNLGNWHPFAGRDPSQAQGRLLFLSNYYNGILGGYGLSNDGCFVGVQKNT